MLSMQGPDAPALCSPEALAGMPEGLTLLQDSSRACALQIPAPLLWHG